MRVKYLLNPLVDFLEACSVIMLIKCSTRGCFEGRRVLKSRTLVVQNTSLLRLFLFLFLFLLFLAFEIRLWTNLGGIFLSLAFGSASARWQGKRGGGEL